MLSGNHTGNSQTFPRYKEVIVEVVTTIPQKRVPFVAVVEEIPSQHGEALQAKSSSLGEDDAQSDDPMPPLKLVITQAASQGSSEGAALKANTIDVEAMLHLETPSAKGTCNIEFLLKNDPGRFLFGVRHGLFLHQCRPS